MPRVIGLDLAAEASGFALPDGTTRTILAPKLKPSGRKRTLTDDLARLDHIAGQVATYLALHEVDLAVIEDYAAGIKSSAVHRLAEIGGAVRLACYRAGVPIALVNVQHLKIYATGKGGATKTQMGVAAHSRAGLEFRNEDECDAWWLRALGLDHFGHPVVDMPQLNRAVLAKVHWPLLAEPEPATLFDQPERTTSA